MKLLFLLLSFAAAAIAGAQTTSMALPKQQTDLLNLQLKDQKFKNPAELRRFLDSSFTMNRAAQIPSAGVYNLPQDNMPCIVPDRNGVVPMPNMMKPRIPFNSEIPNAAPGQKIDPKKLKWKPVYISKDAAKP